MLKDIEGYDGEYQIDEDGNIYSQKSKRFLRIYEPENGYCSVSLSHKGKVKTFKIHRLVAETFLPNPNNLSDVNHIDENKHNNNVLNLEWCSHKYNANYGTSPQRIRQKQINNVNSRKQWKAVAQYTLDGELIAVYPRASEAAQVTGTSAGNIRSAAKGTSKTAAGYKWQYIDGGDEE